MGAIPLHRRPSDLPGALATAFETLHHQAEAFDIDLQLDSDKNVPRDANIDVEKIGWAITTLVGNAYRYVKHGTRLHPGGSIQVRIRYEEATDTIVVRVQDDGPGIPKEKLPSLLTRAKDTHAAGLALILIHDVVVAHGGTMTVESVCDGLEHGTVFTMRLPAHEA